MFGALKDWWYRKRPQRSVVPRAHPQLECLEDRQLLSAALVGGTVPAALHSQGNQVTVAPPVVVAPTAENSPILAQTYARLNVKAPAQQLVIRSADALLAQTGMSAAQLEQMLGVPSINWTSQMVVMVSQGTGSYGAASPQVDITDLKVANDTLTVDWHLQQPNPHQVFPMWMTITDPAEFVLVKRFDGPVTFHQGATVILPPPPYEIVLPITVAKAISSPGAT